MRRKNYFGSFDNIFEQFFGHDFYSRNEFMNPVWMYYETKRTPMMKGEDNRDITYETVCLDDGCYFLIKVPGFNKENLNISGENRQITVSGEREVNLGSEKRTESIDFSLPTGEIDFNKVEATIADGILTLFIPGMKKNEETKKKSTTIKIN